MSKRNIGVMNVETLATRRPAKVGKKYSLERLEAAKALNRKMRRALERLTKPKTRPR